MPYYATSRLIYNFKFTGADKKHGQNYYDIHSSFDLADMQYCDTLANGGIQQPVVTCLYDVITSFSIR